MQTLRKLMSELTTSIGQATAPTSSSVSNATPQQKRSNRSSIANLEALWTSHLQALWKRVEGSQKFLPAVPGRHIIYESGRWVELNAATWKAKRRIHMILLNDHLLVAAEKKRTEPSTQDPREARQNNAQGVGHFVAQRCWPLSDVQMLDLASRTATGGGSSRSGNTNASNAINVRVGIESFTYVTMGSEDDEKAILITTFRKAAEDMRQVQDAQAEAKERARDSLNYFALRDPAISEKHELVDGLAESADLSAASFTDSDGKERDLRWVEGQLDTLDIDIALQQCEQAVSVVENLRWLAKSVQSNSPVYNLVSAKIDARAEKLASIVVKQLLETHSQSGPTQENVGWLLKLGFEDRARIQYLTIRTVIFQKRLR